MTDVGYVLYRDNAKAVPVTVEETPTAEDVPPEVVGDPPSETPVA